MVTHRKAVAAAPLGIAVIAGGLLVVREPLLSVVAVAAVVVLGAIMLRVAWAVLLYVAAEPFGNYLGMVHPEAVKLVGLLLFAAWLLHLAADNRPARIAHPALYAAAAFLLVVLASTALNPHGAAGLQVAARYLSYLAVLVVLVDTMRTVLPPRRVAAVYVASCGVATVPALVTYFGAGGRAGGPIEDPNDFALHLVTALPFALLLWREPTRHRHLFGVVAALLVVTILATFSRGALLGVAAVVVVGVALGLIELRRLIGVGVVLAVAVGLGAAAAPELVERSVAEKQYVADANVESRLASWTLAAEMTADDPLLGKGPGGFQEHVPAYEARTSPDPAHLTVVHQMFLEVSAELGLLGLVAFVLMIGAAVAGAGRAALRGVDRDLAAAVCASFAGTLTAAMFLTEQYFLPVWLLVALGAVLDPGARKVA